MAYAALVSVSQTLQQILDSDPYFFPYTKGKVKSFHKIIDSLIAFLDNCPPICTQTVSNLITRIRDSAYVAEDVLESIIETHFLQKYGSESYEKFRMFPPSLEKVKKDIESLVKEFENFHQDGNAVYEQRIQTLASSSRQLESVLETLNQILDIDPCFLPRNRKRVKLCQEEIDSLRLFYETICPQTVDDLMRQIEFIAFDAADLFGDLIANHSLLKYGSDRYEKLKMFRGSLEKVMENFGSIEEEMKKIQQHGYRVHEQGISTGSSRPVLMGNNTKMVALDNNLEVEVQERLVERQSKIDVIPLVGMGGIGKTTLARILYDSQLIWETFDVCGWGTISQTYNVEKIISEILKDIEACLNKKKEDIGVVPKDKDKDAKKQLYQTLCGRKYLIILDDVWDTRVWDEIKSVFPDNNNDSRIILTTRHSEVAAYAISSSSTYHEMQLLNEDSSWSLLCQEIFPQKNCPSELVEIGKEIARKCQGLPLAISAVAGHLKTEKQREEYWKYVSENISSVLRTADDPSLEILSLSYNYLPHHLKACFLYFGFFQEDFTIDVSEILRLWIAEGFVKPRESISLEKVAEEYLSCVIERNLIFVYEYDSFWKPKTCGIHDLFRDICIREAKKEKFPRMYSIVPVDLMDSQRRFHTRLNIRNDSESPPSSLDIRNGSCLAIRSFSCPDVDDGSAQVLPASGSLKVLNVQMEIYFPLVLELGNLKYLQLGKVSEIPSSISGLWNLQTLIASFVSEKSMPSEIWEMPHLRHLLIPEVHLPTIPDVQGKGTKTYVLKNLQTLSEIIDFSCTQEALTRIPNLKKLKITYQNDVGLESHSLNNLVYLHALETLCCKVIVVQNDNILRNLAFPISLKKLVLAWCQIPWEQMTIIGVLPKLEVLKLKDGATKGKLWETTDGEFKHLKFLFIQASDIVEWITENDHFPGLRHLILKVCKHLKAIPSEIGEIPTLEIIELDGCSPEAESSAKEILGEDSDIELKIVNSYAHSSSVQTRIVV